MLLLLALGELTVSELAGILGQSQPRVSRHLRVLAEAGLVERFPEGAWVFYRLAGAAVLDGVGIDAANARSWLPAPDLIALAETRARTAQDAAAYFAAHAQDWAQLRRRHVDEAEVEAALIELSGGSAERLLDLGTGTGRMLLVFKDRYSSAIGVDSSAEMLAIARAQLIREDVTNAQVRRTDFLEEDLPIDADIVCLHHVLHFLAEPERAIAVAADALSESGRVLIADFAPHTDEDLRDRHAHRRLGFARTEIEAWARHAGLALTAERRLDPPDANGLVTCVWRLDRQHRPGRAAPGERQIASAHVNS